MTKPVVVSSSLETTNRHQPLVSQTPQKTEHNSYTLLVKMQFQQQDLTKSWLSSTAICTGVRLLVSLLCRYGSSALS
jgi:hypothetical protein